MPEIAVLPAATAEEEGAPFRPGYIVATRDPGEPWSTEGKTVFPSLKGAYLEAARIMEEAAHG
ncbi:MAG: hypothetical protein P1V51_20155 [Deltaproteobacteria bacterium]|nr:hypothetical protein [Deltaproteobacteria bacterium]